MSKIDYAGSLERIVAWGNYRIRSGRWRNDGWERLYAAQWLRWSLLLEIAGVPGGTLPDYSWGGISSPELPRIVLAELVKNGLVRSRQGKLSAVDEAGEEVLDGLWEWLDQHTPDGYPPGW